MVQLPISQPWSFILSARSDAAPSPTRASRKERALMLPSFRYCKLTALS
jgi:hypothetical protein